MQDKVYEVCAECGSDLTDDREAVCAKCEDVLMRWERTDSALYLAERFIRNNLNRIDLDMVLPTFKKARLVNDSKGGSKR